MSETHSKTESKKSPLFQCNDGEITEETDVITPLAALKTERRPPSLGAKALSVTLIFADESVHAPPSFAESQFATIVRRQRPRDTALKVSNVPTRYPNLPRDFEFAGYQDLSSWH